MKIRLLLFLCLLSTTLLSAQNPYPINFDKNQPQTNTLRLLKGLSLTTSNGEQTLKASPRPYSDLTSKTLYARPGEPLTFKFNYALSKPGSGAWMHGYVYLDQHNDGRFDIPAEAPLIGTESDLLAYSYYEGKNSTGLAADPGSSLNPPTFTVPTSLPTGRYRLRLKIDWNNIDPGGALSPTDHTPTGDNGIIKNGGAIVDTYIEIKGTPYTPVTLYFDTRNAAIYGKEGALPNTVADNSPLSLHIAPPDKGYEVEKFSIRYGPNVKAAQKINGIQQWEQLDTLPDKNGDITLPARIMKGEVLIQAYYKPGPNARYFPVFADEFEGTNGSLPDSKVWSHASRRSSTWSRWCSNAKEVVFIQDGELVCRAIPTPYYLRNQGEKAPMITGGVKSEGKFSFLYGRAEARIFSTPHRGNFPAFWMMPNKSIKGWPNDGEIDIWEMINAESTAYHTIHSHWTYDLKHKNDPMSHFRTNGVDYSRYHIFAVEWNPTTITWSVDGKVVGTAQKSSDTNALSNGQWPYTHPFALILNQSVGDGSWASNPDLTFTYETRFDWVRVYQTKAQNPLVGIVPQKIDTETHSTTRVYDLNGRTARPSDTGIQILDDGRKILR